MEGKKRMKQKLVYSQGVKRLTHPLPVCFFLCCCRRLFSFCLVTCVLFECRNQESSSESLHAWYHIAELGVALSDPTLIQTGTFLFSLELISVKHYWHMLSTSDPVYPPPYSQGMCTGMIWSDKVVQQTWFASGLPYVHGINILPISDASQFILSHHWVSLEYPVLAAHLHDPANNPPVDDVWFAFAWASLAVLDPREAWNKAILLSKWDNGLTKTNLLWWIATRPIQGIEPKW